MAPYRGAMRAPYCGGMGRWLLTPRWIGLHLLVLVAVASTAALGWWQWDVSKQRYAASRHVRPDGPVVALRAVLIGSAVDPSQAGRLVRVSGRFDPAHQLLVAGRRLHARPGYWVVTPLLPTGEPAGGAVMVVRGWVPAGPTGAAPAVPPPVTGTVTVTGWAGAPEQIPDASSPVPPAGQVEALNAALLVNLLPYPVLDGFLAQLSSVPAASPGPAALPRPSPRGGGSWPLQNLSYVLQWWIFGAAAVWFWVLSVRNEAEVRAQREAESAARSDRTTRCSA